jgi:hypothetical protein
VILQAAKFQKPSRWRRLRRLSRRLTWQTVLTIAAAAFVLAYPIYTVLDEAATHGIRQVGNLTVVDLKAMSDFSFDQVKGINSDIPAVYRRLNGKRVMLAGQMWLPDSATGKLTRFELVYSVATCCFAGPPLVQHFVDARVLPGHTVDYTSGQVDVIGVLHVGVVRSGGAVASIYRIDVQKVEQ